MPKSFPYYNKAIMESGAFQTWSYKTWRDSNWNSVQFARHVNCTNANGNTTPAADIKVDIDCLLKTDVMTLVEYGDDGNGLASRSPRTLARASACFLPLAGVAKAPRCFSMRLVWTS